MELALVTMTSVEIAQITGKEHKNIMRDIEDEISKLGTEISQLIFEPSEYVNERGRRYPCYNLKKDGVLQLGARYDAKIRFTLIQKMNQLEEDVKILKTKLTEKEQLKLMLFSDNSLEVVNAHKQLIAIEVSEATKPLVEKIENDKPLVDFADGVIESADSMEVGEFAKVLNNDEDIETGRNRLYSFLRDIKLILQDSTTPSQYAITQNYLELAERIYYDEIGRPRIYTVTKITGKGQIYIRKKYLAYLETIEE